MNAVLSFIFLSFFISSCQLKPVSEFDIDYQNIQELEKSYQNCQSNCQEEMASECQCLNISQKTNCTDQLIENGLRNSNLVCNTSDKTTHKTCRLIERLKNLLIADQTLCGEKVSQKHILQHFKKVYQKSNSIAI